MPAVATEKHNHQQRGAKGLSRDSLLHPEICAAEPRETGPHPRSRRRLPGPIARWIESRKLLGLQTHQLCWELHIVQGRSKADTARLLDMSVTRVCQCIDNCEAELLSRQPKTDDDFAKRRLQLSERIQAVHDAACPSPAELTYDEGTGKLVEPEPDPRLLAIRLKALEQQAKLWGLNLERPADGGQTIPAYATPAEIAEAVQRRALELHGTADDVAAVKLALMPPTTAE